MYKLRITPMTNTFKIVRSPCNDYSVVETITLQDGTTKENFFYSTQNKERADKILSVAVRHELMHYVMAMQNKRMK
jgi:hypothetical protein